MTKRRDTKRYSVRYPFGRHYKTRTIGTPVATHEQRGRRRRRWSYKHGAGCNRCLFAQFPIVARLRCHVKPSNAQRKRRAWR